MEEAPLTQSSQTYTIGGKVTGTDGSAVGGVLLTLSGSASAQTTTDVGRNYSFGSYPGGGNYSITPSKTNYSFSPESRSFENLNSNQPNTNFTAAQVSLQFSQVNLQYPLSLDGLEFIDLLLRTAQNASVDLSDQRPTLINDFNTYGSRARIAYLVAENQTFRLAKYNKAFVLMEYFGYLRRDPDENGYQFWLEILNNRVPNNYVSMVCAFLTSAEYQERFSSVRTRNDNVCSQAQ